MQHWSGLEIEAEIEATVAAVLLFGDTRHTAGQPYNVGSGAGRSSYYPRAGRVLDKINAYATILRSYCVSTDPVCAQGDDVSTHLDYFQRSTDDAAKWVRSMVDMEKATASTTATRPVASSSQAASETGSTAVAGENVGADKVASTSSGLPTTAETDASTTATSTATSTATGPMTSTATSDNGVDRLSCQEGLTWTVVMIGLCLIVGQ